MHQSKRRSTSPSAWKRKKTSISYKRQSCGAAPFAGTRRICPLSTSCGRAGLRRPYQSDWPVPRASVRRFLSMQTADFGHGPLNWAMGRATIRRSNPRVIAELHGRFPCECPSQRGRSLRSRGSRGLRAQARPKEASECEIGLGERGAGGAHHQGLPALVRLPPLLV